MRCEAGKARRMWATYNTCDRLPSIAYLKHSELPVKPVAVLDLSDPEALVKQVAIELAECKEWAYFEKARSLLSSLGIPTAKPKERKAGKSLGLLSGKAGKGKK